MSADVKIIRSSDIGKCPLLNLTPRHYRADGTCLCDEQEQAKDQLQAAREIFVQAREDLANAKQHARDTGLRVDG